MAELNRPVRVFISSASGALAPYRQAAVDVCHRLGLQPVHMEEFDPERPPPLQVCRRKVDGCDVFVLLLAHRYGARPPGEERSYTELEYRWALSRPELPLLAFVVDPSFPWPPPDVDDGADGKALRQLISQVISSHEVRRFGELRAFREDLILALRRDEALAEPDEPSRPAPRPLPTPPAFHAVPPYVGGAPFTGRAGDLARLDQWGRSADPVMVVEAIGGTGKSALTWEWARTRAPDAVGGLAGQLWWSFYEGSASITRFLQELLAYASGWPLEEVEQLDRTELSTRALNVLRERPYLLVLDGFERLLAAYHRFDPSKLRDEEVEQTKRSLIEPLAEELVRELVAAGPSKVLISTRLMPNALDGRFGRRLPGVQHLRLPGLTDADTVELLDRLDVRGDERATTEFFRRLDNHPLLVGIVAGLVRDYRPDPGGFDRWLADPTAGDGLAVPDLNLTQRRAHILDAALAGLPPGHRRLLGWISVLAGAVDWATVEAINPFRPEPPAPVRPNLSTLDPEPYPLNPFDYRSPRPQRVDYRPAGQDEQADERNRWEAWMAKADQLRAEAQRDTEEQLAAWRSSEEVVRANAQLDSALRDLEDRGLLWWDRPSNSYDLHPIVRAYAYDQLEDTDRVQANERVRDHFQALPPEDPAEATSVEDLRQTITIFRALIGAGRLDDAAALWNSDLEQALVVELGAYATVIELLTPLATHGPVDVRADLSIAYIFLRRHEQAIDHEARILEDTLHNETEGAVKGSLTRLSVCLADSGAEIGYSRALDLRGALLAAVDDEENASLCFARAVQAGLHGQAERALALLDEAERLDAPPNDPWFEGDLRLRRLWLTLVRDGSLTEDQLAAAAEDLYLWRHRMDLAFLRYRLFTRQERYALALDAAEEKERLERNAGLETVPAASAYMLAKLGRREEASAAVQESLALLPRIHPAARPHELLARALWELGRHADAVQHALAHYRQAWRDGPPYCRFWELRDARDLLDRMGVPPPDLPTADPATVKIPLEDEVRAFIANLAKTAAQPKDWRPRRPGR